MCTITPERGREDDPHPFDILSADGKLNFRYKSRPTQLTISKPSSPIKIRGKSVKGFQRYDRTNRDYNFIFIDIIIFSLYSLFRSKSDAHTIIRASKPPSIINQFIQQRKQVFIFYFLYLTGFSFR